MIAFDGRDPPGMFESARSLEAHVRHLEILENLGLGKREHVQLGWNGASPGLSVLRAKLWDRLTHPIIDTQEIVALCAAVDELIDRAVLDPLADFIRDANLWGDARAGQGGENPFSIRSANAR